MKRALDNITDISTENLKQRKHELLSELAIFSKKNKTARRAVIADYAKIIWELNKR